MANRPKPKALKVIHGTSRVDRDNPESPEYSVPKDECPKWLPSSAKKIWHEYFEILTKSGVLQKNSLETFGKWCIAAAKTRKLAKKTDKESMCEWRQTMSIERLLAIELGLTPASQGKVSGGKSEPETKGIVDGLWQKAKGK